tara:strand:+ start:543 stop:779 length:237 start_codon:yes stop_codon:yes gene_type:complete
MFTVEFESDASIVKTLDQKGKHEDVEVIFGDEGMVYIRQYDPEEDDHQLIIMSGQQWIDIMAAYKSSAGSYYVELKHE